MVFLFVLRESNYRLANNIYHYQMVSLAKGITKQDQNYKEIL
jgi:hypothetical protein